MMFYGQSEDKKKTTYHSISYICKQLACRIYSFCKLPIPENTALNAIKIQGVNEVKLRDHLTIVTLTG